MTGSSYWDPAATNAAGYRLYHAGGPCPGDVFLVGNGINQDPTATYRLRQDEFMPRLGVAYSWIRRPSFARVTVSSSSPTGSFST